MNKTLMLAAVLLASCHTTPPTAETTLSMAAEDHGLVPLPAPTDRWRPGDIISLDGARPKLHKNNDKRFLPLDRVPITQAVESWGEITMQASDTSGGFLSALFGLVGVELSSDLRSSVSSLFLPGLMLSESLALDDVEAYLLDPNTPESVRFAFDREAGERYIIHEVVFAQELQVRVRGWSQEQLGAEIKRPPGELQLGHDDVTIQESSMTIDRPLAVGIGISSVAVFGERSDGSLIVETKPFKAMKRADRERILAAFSRPPE